MPKSAPGQYNFNGGEISPFAQGRVDEPWYKKSLDTCLNSIPLVQGGLTRRPGTKYVKNVKDSSKATRMIRHYMSKTQAYGIEVGDGYFRFYRNGARIGAPYEVVHTYAQADLWKLRYAGDGADLYIACTGYPLMKLTCITDANWTFAAVSLTDGPYLPRNKTTTTFTLSAGVGSGVTLTASAATGINGGDGFKATDVGRLISFKRTILQAFANDIVLKDVNQTSLDGEVAYAAGAAVPISTRTWLLITGFTNSTHVTVTVRGPTTDTTATRDWALGLFSDTTGYPSYVTFHEGRMWLLGVTAFPKILVGSVSSYYEDFTPDDMRNSGTVTITDSSALNFTLLSRDADKLLWGEPDEKGLLLGSAGDESTFRPSTLAAATTPTNIDAKGATSYGSGDAAPLKLGNKSILFAQRYGQKIRELSFAFEINGYRAPDRTMYAEHITGAAGIVEMAYQKEPQALVWCVRADGVLAAMTHEEENGVTTAGWSRHVLGGTNVVVESAIVLPSADTTRDEVWLAVKRTINGATVRTIEILQKIFTIFDVQADAWFLDCAITYSNATPFTSVGGLGHLVGETVAVWGDGAPKGSYVVSAGGVAGPWDGAVSQVQVGLDYNSDGKMLRLESGSANGTALGKLRRTHRVGFLLQQFGPIFNFGTDFAKMTPKDFRTVDMNESEAVPLFSGIISESFESDYDFDNKICWRINSGMPGTILAVLPRMDTQDGE